MLLFKYPRRVKYPRSKPWGRGTGEFRTLALGHMGPTMGPWGDDGQHHGPRRGRGELHIAAGSDPWGGGPLMDGPVRDQEILE